MPFAGTVRRRLGSEERTPGKTAELKRLVDRGKYEVDPERVADAMIRRGMWTRGPRWHPYRYWPPRDDRRS